MSVDELRVGWWSRLCIFVCSQKLSRHLMKSPGDTLSLEQRRIKKIYEQKLWQFASFSKDKLTGSRTQGPALSEGILVCACVLNIAVLP